MEQSNQNTEQPIIVSAPKAKGCGHVPIIVLLTILALGGIGFGGFEFYQNLQNNRTVTTTNANNETKGPEQKSVGQDKITTSSTSFQVISPATEATGEKGEVRTYTGVANGILSIYSNSDYLHPYGHIVSEIKAENIDIESGKRIKNAVFLERMGSTVADVYRAMLTDITKNNNLDSILLNTHGDVSGESISVSNFKKKIDEYVKQLEDDDGLFYVFFKDSNVAVAYQQYEVLEALGMGTHMGAGLKSGYTEILLDESKEDDDEDDDSEKEWIDCMPPLSEAEAKKCEKAEKEGYPYIAY